MTKKKAPNQIAKQMTTETSFKLIEKPRRFRRLTARSAELDQLCKTLRANPTKAVEIDVNPSTTRLRFVIGLYKTMKLRGIRIRTAQLSETKVAVWLHEDEV